MDSTTPKVSFIPKGTLVRETPFLERRRPRSAIGILATLTFVASIGGYAGLYFYNASLGEQIAAKTEDIGLVQQKFSDAPQISKAQIFSSRAELAKELLDGHTVVSPVFTFLSKYTIESIFYDKFLFARDGNIATLELSGEAPTYAALAYQGDILRKRTEELSKFTISNVALTKFGTVSFSLLLAFTPEYLSYSKSLSYTQNPIPKDSAATMVTKPDTGVLVISTSTFSSVSSSTIVVTPDVVPADTEVKEDMTSAQKPEASVVLSPAEKQSVLGSFWSRFKFW